MADISGPKVYVNSRVEKHANALLGLLRARLSSLPASKSTHHEAEALRSWAATFCTLMYRACKGVLTLCATGQGWSARLLMRAVIEYGFKFQYVRDNHDHAYRIMLADRLGAKSTATHTTLSDAQRKRLDFDLAQTRALYRELEPSLAMASEKDVDEHLKCERFPDVASLTRMYGMSDKYFAHKTASLLLHGDATTIRLTVQSVDLITQALTMNESLSDGMENHWALQACGYALTTWLMLRDEYGVGDMTEYEPLAEQQKQLLSEFGE